MALTLQQSLAAQAATKAKHDAPYIGRVWWKAFAAGVPVSKWTDAELLDYHYHPYRSVNAVSAINSIRGAGFADDAKRAQAVEFELNTRPSTKPIQDAQRAEVARINAMSGGGMFGGFISSIVNPIAQVAKASLQVATLGNANAVIKPLQEVARNPIVQAVAVGALTVYTGGLAAAAMGGGALATAGGTMLASAAVGKAQGQSFNLQNSLVTGATAGVGEYAKGAELLSNATANAAAVSSLTNAVQGKLQGKAFNLQDTLQAGAEAGLAKWGAPKGDASIMPIPNPVADFVQGAKAVYQLKQAVDTMHNQQAQADQAKAVAQQQTAQINADQAHIDAVKKEIAALEAQAAQAKQSPQQQPQTSTAQTYTASEKMAAASVLLGLLKLFA